MGPLLFLIYISDLPSAVSFSELLSFADDTKCFKCIQNPDDCTNFQLDLSSLQNWSNNNHLLFNVLKFVQISFHSHPPHTTHSYHVDNNTISLHSHHKDLGIIISSDLSWNNHYNYISSRAYKLLGLLRLSFSSINSQSGKKLLYISLIRSQLSYSSQIWQPHLLKDIQSLERATKFISNDYDSDYKSRLQTLHLLQLMYHLNSTTSYSSLTALKIYPETSTSSIISTSLKVTLETRPIQNWSTHLFLLTLAVTSTLLDSLVFGTLSLLWTSPYQPTLSKTLLLTSSGLTSQTILTPLIRVPTTTFVPVPNVPVLLLLLIP